MDKNNDVEKLYNQDYYLADYHQNVSSFEFPLTKSSTSYSCFTESNKNKLAIIASICDNSNNIACLKSDDDLEHVLTQVIPLALLGKENHLTQTAKYNLFNKRNGSFQVNLLKNLQLMKQRIVMWSYMLLTLKFVLYAFAKMTNWKMIVLTG